MKSFLINSIFSDVSSPRMVGAVLSITWKVMPCLESLIVHGSVTVSFDFVV